MEIIDIDSDEEETSLPSNPILIEDLFSLTLKESDYSRLEPETYLNDNLIDFFLNLYIANNSKFYAFNSFFYHTYTQQGYEKVKKWFTKSKIFSKQYWLIPIAQNDHWVLLVIMYPLHAFTKKSPQSAMLLFDSLDCNALDPKQQMEKFMQKEWRNLGKIPLKIDIPLYLLKLPLQNNQWDCGLFVLEYAERFIKNPKVFNPQPAKSFSNWFDIEELENKRYLLKNIILQIHEGVPLNQLSNEVFLYLKDPDPPAEPKSTKRLRSRPYRFD